MRYVNFCIVLFLILLSTTDLLAQRSNPNVNGLKSGPPGPPSRGVDVPSRGIFTDLSRIDRESNTSLGQKLVNETRKIPEVYRLEDESLRLQLGLGSVFGRIANVQLITGGFLSSRINGTINTIADFFDQNFPLVNVRPGSPTFDNVLKRRKYNRKLRQYREVFNTLADEARTRSGAVRMEEYELTVQALKALEGLYDEGAELIFEEDE